MNYIEGRLLDLLRDLRTNYCVCGVKAEFEAEGTKLDEAYRLKELVSKTHLDFTIKIGGCEAIKEMHEAKAIGVNSIVAPMIETPYALSKYINAVKKVFTDVDTVKYYANIETITGFHHFDEIIASPEFDTLTGIVLGRGDLTGSMGLTKDHVDSNDVFKIASVMAEKMHELQKDFIIGGNISNKSVEMFKHLPENSLSKFETRKIIFNSQAMHLPNIKEGILKAIEFEVLWLKNKRNEDKIILDDDQQRLTVLEARYNKMLKESGLDAISFSF